ncbi:hypothetical protein QN397_13555 [Variovorax sp. RTB1]|uniref:hypothetical protein n=1 Tax=Variovorax sp. RTB1 TaxID=3048631 RepID=UPI002B225874|nr:hypothetical protein [Variovorax sp. RTB1]MEB0112381.1 hypothetical protein [Variovorax sp. RTB1]
MSKSGEVLWTLDGRTTRQGAGVYTGNAAGTLANMASQGTGPVFVKRGKKVWYFRNDLDRWLAAGRVTSTAQGRLLASELKAQMPSRAALRASGTQLSTAPLQPWPAPFTQAGNDKQ